MLCLAFIRTAHSFSTCSSLERCGTCKRLMSIETFRHNANYRQMLHRHFIDKQTGNMHTAGTLQVADITAAPPLEYLQKNVYMFFQLGDVPFSNIILKIEGENCFQQFLGILSWSCNWIFISSFLLQVTRRLLELSSK